jgi:hypothetical protein
MTSVCSAPGCSAAQVVVEAAEGSRRRCVGLTRSCCRVCPCRRAAAGGAPTRGTCRSAAEAYPLGTFCRQAVWITDRNKLRINTCAEPSQCTSVELAGAGARCCSKQHAPRIPTQVRTGSGPRRRSRRGTASGQRPGGCTALGPGGRPRRRTRCRACRGAAGSAATRPAPPARAARRRRPRRRPRASDPRGTEAAQRRRPERAPGTRRGARTRRAARLRRAWLRASCARRRARARGAAGSGRTTRGG